MHIRWIEKRQLYNERLFVTSTKTEDDKERPGHEVPADTFIGTSALTAWRSSSLI